MFCLQCALSCVGRHCLSAAELQRAFLPFQGTDLKQLTPGSRTLWQAAFFLLVQIFSLGSLKYQQAISSLTKQSPALPYPGTVFCWAPSISDRDKHQSLHLSVPSCSVH